MGLYVFPVIHTIKDKEQIFCSEKETWFLKKIENIKETSNMNIDDIFYDKLAYEEYMNKTKSTKLEEIWRTRYSFLYTPRGNVIMYYDVYRMGFAYYSDQSKLSYEILNACAMNYVVQYRCLNFYIDEMTSPNFVDNPIAKIEIEELKKNENNNNNNNNNSNHKMGFKIQTVEPNKNMANLKKVDNKNKKADTISEVPKIKNKFIHVGKISNMNLLKKPVTSKPNILFKTNIKSELMNILEENADAQKNIFSYADYKQMKKNV